MEGVPDYNRRPAGMPIAESLASEAKLSRGAKVPEVRMMEWAASADKKGQLW